jgi:hypothetical protein
MVAASVSSTPAMARSRSPPRLDTLRVGSAFVHSLSVAVIWSLNTPVLFKCMFLLQWVAPRGFYASRRRLCCSGCTFESVKSIIASTFPEKAIERYEFNYEFDTPVVPHIA